MTHPKYHTSHANPAKPSARMANARMAAAGPSPSPTPPPDGGEALSPLASLFQWLDPHIPDQLGVVSA